MSSHDNNEPDGFEDRDLDALIRKATQDEAPENARLDESVILAYLNGMASEEQTAQVQALLARSPALRQQAREIITELEELGTAETAAAFARHPDPAVPENPFAGRARTSIRDTPPGRLASGMRRSFGEMSGDFLRGLQSLFLKPAFAYAFTATLLAYPAISYFTTRSAETLEPDRAPHDVVINPQVFQLRPEVRLRGEVASPSLEISLTESTNILDLELLSAVPTSADHRVEVEVSDSASVLWRDDDFQGLTGTDGSYHYHLFLDARQLKPATLRIRMIRFDRDSGQKLHTEDYTLLLK